MRIEALSEWTREQRSVVIASFLGWALDAFDFFLLVFVLKDIAREFGAEISGVTFAILLTLAMRPIGAFLFGRAAFLMQFMVQGAWGVIPVHLNELSPDEARGTFPGLVYQLGNLLASANATIQAGIATHFGGNYGLALALVASSVAIIIAILTSLDDEAKGVAFGTGRRQPAAT